MATYNLKFNKDDSVVRHVVVGLLADLNSKLSFWRQISNDERATVDVPFFYAVSGDENFLKDNFLFSNVNGEGCDPDGAFADGNYDKIPRGIVNLTSFAVDPSKLVNKRNMGQYSMMNEEGLMEGFVAEFEMIPVVIGVDVEILVSSQLDLFKITEAIVKKMYKANFYNVDAGHLEEGTYRISSEYMMPDDYTQEKPVEYSFDDKSNHKITFSLEISSFIPSFDFEEDTYRKFTRTTYANATCGDYENPNGFLNPTMTPNVYYDSYVPAKWVANGNEWVKTQEGIDCSDPTVRAGLGIEQNTESQIKRVRKRRKQSNRMFTIKNGPGPSNVQTENEKSMLGDNYTVKGRDYPFGGKITP
jgi:hypothetical protein|tara:strand:- start:2427 stop:3503 length:1077 start_codon:yes stop_codon:yes gene_type:complete